MLFKKKQTVDLVFTLGLSERQVRALEALLKPGRIAAKHFWSLEELVEAFREERPGLILAEPRFTEESVHGALKDDSVTVTWHKFLDQRELDIDDEILGGPPGLGAVMTVFDQMPDIDDSDPWKKRPI